MAIESTVKWLLERLQKQPEKAAKSDSTVLPSNETMNNNNNNQKFDMQFINKKPTEKKEPEVTLENDEKVVNEAQDIVKHFTGG